MSVSYDVAADAASRSHLADLLTVPPGFKKGVDFGPKGESDKHL